MAVEFKNVGGALNTSKTQDSSKRASVENDQAQAQSARSDASDDRVTLTDRGKELIDAVKASASAGEGAPVNEARVAELKEQIANDTYKVDSLKLAGKFLDFEAQVDERS